ESVLPRRDPGVPGPAAVVGPDGSDRVERAGALGSSDPTPDPGRARLDAEPHVAVGVDVDLAPHMRVPARRGRATDCLETEGRLRTGAGETDRSAPEHAGSTRVAVPPQTEAVDALPVAADPDAGGVRRRPVVDPKHRGFRGQRVARTWTQ